MKPTVTIAVYVIILAGSLFTLQELKATAQQDSLEHLPTFEKIQLNYQRLAQAETNRDTVALADALSSLISLNVLMENYERADELKDRALTLLPHIDDPLLLIMIYRALGNFESNRATLYIHIINGARKQTDPRLIDHRKKGVKWARKALNTALVHNIEDEIPRAYYQLGQKQIFLVHKDPSYRDSTRIHLEKAIHHAKKIDNLEVLAGAHNWMGAVYYPVNQDSALKHLAIADSVIKKIDQENKTWLLHNKHNFTFNAIALKAGLDTLMTLKNLIIAHKMEAYVSEYQNKVAESENRYRVKFHQREAERSQQALQLEQVRVNQQKIIIAIIAFMLLGAGGGSYYLYRLNRKNKKLADNNAMLVREQNHRVKNNLQMISSLLSLQANRSTGPSKDTMLESSRRVQAIALLHRKLYDDLEGVKEVDMKEYTEELVEDILFATGKTDIPVDLAIDQITLPVEKAVHLALILNELVTNSIKHVFSRERLNGERIELIMTQPNGAIELVYRDYGGHFDAEAFETAESLGNQIIRLQARYLADEFDIEEDHGLKFKMKFNT